MFEKASESIKQAQEAFIQRVDTDWALVTAGTPESFNSMTIGWGSAGTLWTTPVVAVYVHPRRFTHEFLLREDYFSVQLFDESHKRDLATIGSKSGRDGDKVALTDLVPIDLGQTMGFADSQVTLVCRKIYTHRMDLEAVPNEVKERFAARGGLYDEEAHTVFVGEVIDAQMR